MIEHDLLEFGGRIFSGLFGEIELLLQTINFLLSSLIGGIQSFQMGNGPSNQLDTIGGTKGDSGKNSPQ